jgi:hypothetical protein
MDAICPYDHIRIANGTISESQPRSASHVVDGNTAMPEPNRSRPRTKEHLEELDAVNLIARRRRGSRRPRNRLSP